MVFVVDLEELKLKYFCNGLDVPYKLKDNNILNIKPILVQDYPYFETAKQILEIAKNEINDIEVIKMSYLEFLLKIILSQSDMFVEYFLSICKLCFGFDKVATDKMHYKNIYLCDENRIVKYIISSKDFDDIIKIILNQNDANYDNRYISPDVRELMNTYYNTINKNIRIPELEEKKAYVTSKTGLSLNELNKMTYRFFDLVYTSSLNSEIYIAQKMIQCSEKYEVKEDIKHPLFEKKTDPYSEIFEETSILSSKGFSGANNLNLPN